MLEFLVTAQAYEKNDPYKQTILLHETFMVHNEDEARSLFKNKFMKEFHIIRIYSAIDVTMNRI